MSNNGTQCLCVCACVCVFGEGEDGGGTLGGPLFQTGRQKCWEGRGKVKERLNLEHLRSSIPNILTYIWLLTYTGCYFICFQELHHYARPGLVILKLLLDLFRLYPTLHSSYQFLDTKRDVYSKTEISGNNYCLDKNLRLRRHYSTYRVKS